MNRNFYQAIFIAIVWSFSFIAQSNVLPRLVLSTNNNTASPGDVITFDVKFSGVDVSEEVLLQLGIIDGVSLTSDNGQSLFDTTYPFLWEISVDKSGSGTQTFKAQVIYGLDLLESNEIEISVNPKMEELKNIYFSPSDTAILYPGDKLALKVIGRFRDGYNREVTRPVLGTAFTEYTVENDNAVKGNSSSIDVDKDGVITALTPGVSQVESSIGEISNIRRIVVLEPILLTGDTDNDGDVDRDDVMLLKSKYGQKTDDANYDLNGDGIVNVLDIRYQMSICSRTRCSVN